MTSHDELEVMQGQGGAARPFTVHQASVGEGAEMEEKMRIELREIKPNPMRDFKIDPIDNERVAALTESIKDDGF
jgi:hypothetical protein